MVNKPDHAFAGYARIELDAISHMASSHAEQIAYRATVPEDVWHRMDPRTFLVVAVDEQIMLEALCQQQLCSTALVATAPPLLHFPHGTVQCLFGSDLVAQATLLLQDKDRWLPAQLFFIGRLTQSSLQDRPNPRDYFTHGEMYYWYRTLKSRCGSHSALAWLKLLPPGMRDSVRLSESQHGVIVEELDRLLPLPGLFSSLKASNFASILKVRCIDEIQAYSTRLLALWSEALHGIAPLTALDAHTLAEFELLCPAHSSEDALKVANLMEDPLNFPQITDRSKRERLVQRLAAEPRLLSLTAMVSDLGYLSTAQALLGSIFEPSIDRNMSFRSQLRLALRQEYQDSFLLSYIDLTIYALRNIYRLEGPEKGSYITQAAYIAFLLGFHTKIIFRECQDALKVVDQASKETPSISCRNVSIKRRSRCGEPKPNAMTNLWSYLFTHVLFQTYPAEQKKYVSHFAVIQDMIRCFWPGHVEQSMLEQLKWKKAGMSSKDAEKTLRSTWLENFSDIVAAKDAQIRLLQAELRDRANRQGDRDMTPSTASSISSGLRGHGD